MHAYDDDDDNSYIHLQLDTRSRPFTRSCCAQFHGMLSFSRNSMLFTLEANFPEKCMGKKLIAPVPCFLLSFSLALSISHEENEFELENTVALSFASKPFFLEGEVSEKERKKARKIGCISSMPCKCNQQSSNALF